MTLIVDNTCVKATETDSKNASCCVLPFIFKGVQYEMCTDEEHNQPWCSLTENFDVDGKWGVCVGMKKRVSFSRVLDDLLG